MSKSSILLIITFFSVLFGLLSAQFLLNNEYYYAFMAGIVSYGLIGVFRDVNGLMKD